MSNGEVPDYSEETQEAKPDAMKRLSQLAAKMGQLTLEEMDLEEKLKDVQNELKTYQENLVPEIMAEIGMREITTLGGMKIELREEVRASLPKDPERRSAAFAYLKDTGNDGLITREFVINYGRDSTEWAEEFAKKLEELNVGEHAVVKQEETINHQSMCAFLRRELKDGTNVPLEAFGAFVQKFAKIKLKK